MRLGFAYGVYGVLAGLLLSQGGFADTAPDCPAFALRNQNGGAPGSLPLNNADVLKWKAEGRNQDHERGHVQGIIARIYPERNGHQHFAIQLGSNPHDTVEIIYNQDFGPVPDTQVGMSVEACGDYITSDGPSDGPNGQVYPASPDGAIVHWVHLAPRTSGHNSGYLMINGVLTGQDPAHAGPRPPRGSGRGNNGYSPGPDFFSR